MNQETAPLYEKIFVARQPVFTSDMKIWGYELLFRHGEKAQAAMVTDGDQATAQVIADGYAIASAGLRAEAKALINFPRNLLVNLAPYVLPADRCVVEILETVQPEKDVLAACKELKSQGYVLALDDFVGQPGFEPLLEIADLVKVDILHKRPAEVAGIARNLARYGVVLLAEKVENQDMFKVCQRLGFTYFQGFFFSKPEIVPGRKLASGETTKIKLLKELASPDTNIDRLEQIIQTDLSISYRLLRYINSAKFGLRTPVESIRRAVSMLGLQNLRQWLQVIVLSDISTTDRAHELVRLSAQRGRFLQLLAEEHSAPFEPDSMFLLGFFSLLDAILDQQMGQVLEEISLDPMLRSVLSKAGNADSEWIILLEKLDRGDWSGLEAGASHLGLPFDLVDKAVMESSIWTHEIMAG